MNTSARFLIILFFSAGIISCTKSPEISEMKDPDIYYDQNMLDTLWTMDLLNKDLLVSREKIKFIDGFLYATLDIHEEDYDKYIAKVDVEKKNMLWERKNLNLSNVSAKFYDDRVVLKDWESYASIDLKDGSIMEGQEFGVDPNPRGNFYKNFMYFSDEPDRQFRVDLYRVSYDNLSLKEHIYSLGQDFFQNSIKSIESLNSYLDPKTGHEMLVFQHRMVNMENLVGRVDFVFYDMTKGKVTKMYKDIEPKGNSSVAQIFIEDDKAYFQGSNTVYCFDLRTQEMLWYQRYLGDKFTSFGFGNLVYAENEDLIVTKADGDWLIAFDPDTGEEVWVNREAGHNGVPVSYHEGYIYYIISGELRVVRASDGETVAVKRTPLYSNDNFSDGSTVEIDVERKLMYITSGRYIYCAKLIKG